MSIEMKEVVTTYPTQSISVPERGADAITEPLEHQDKCHGRTDPFRE